MKENKALGLNTVQQHQSQLITVKYEQINSEGIVFCVGLAGAISSSPQANDGWNLCGVLHFPAKSCCLLLRSQVPAFMDHLSSCSGEQRKWIKPMFIEPGLAARGRGGNVWFRVKTAFLLQLDDLAQVRSDQQPFCHPVLENKEMWVFHPSMTASKYRVQAVNFNVWLHRGGCWFCMFSIWICCVAEACIRRPLLPSNSPIKRANPINAFSLELVKASI